MMRQQVSEMVQDGRYIELSLDGPMYVAKLFQKRYELALAFGRSETIEEAVQILYDKYRSRD